MLYLNAHVVVLNLYLVWTFTNQLNGFFFIATDFDNLIIQKKTDKNKCFKNSKWQQESKESFVW